jgi:hypothetical protein
MKLSAGTVVCTPSGGAIIFGRFEGIVLAVGLGVAFAVGSCMMLVAMTRLVALSLPIGRSELTAGALLDVTVGVAGMGIVAESELEALVGVSEVVAFPELGGRKVALLGSLEKMDDPGISDAGTLIDPLVGDGAGVDDTKSLPIVPEATKSELDGVIPGVSLASDGVIPTLIDCDGVSLTAGGVMPEGVTLSVSLTAGGVMPEGVTLSVSLGIGVLTPVKTDCERVSLGTGIDTSTVADSEGVGTAPEGVGTMPDGKSDIMLDTRLLASGSEAGMVADGRISDTRFDTILGNTDAGRSGIADVSMLATSDAKDDTRGGRTPDGVGTGDGAAESEGRIDGKIDGRSTGPELGNTTSGVGVGVGVTAGAVPRAVVMPMTIPTEDGSTTKGGSLDAATGSLVGITMMLGTGPVEPTWGVGNASGIPSTEVRRPPRKP